MSDYPSLWWITIPSVLAITGYIVRKWYLARRLRVHGIGKGAPGFQTNVKRIRVTPEIAARIKRGEEVSPEEIAAAAEKADKMHQEGLTSSSHTDRPPLVERIETPSQDSQTESANEWLPESITKPKKRGKARRG
ncbi:hypothetical protein M378DRAFT_13218 [Amanita muscaria Koide BX008]|uniref:Uncharacterized protein n=1 Tax=Amanita muscaria (strain Koide BX008) TaxID=946122 RepID=A0A0C2WZP1_AMAMK|nr:hypothetical protein M378DRAFT_13218 [Amanita muscaria Koide BX008]